MAKQDLGPLQSRSKVARPDIYIYNTMHRQKERFVPMKANRVKLYACGPTVYNLFHLGNARMLVTFDLFRNFLEFVGYEVNFVQNFTDIDDKVIRRAQDEGLSYKDIAERYIKEYYYDADRLGVRHATRQPRATETMDEILRLVQRLIDKGYCYVADDGVYYETRKFKDYGKLSHQPLEELVEGAGQRDTTREGKRHAEDFAVWKFAKPGEPAWASPWGEGRPGWHIECSAMNHKFLGDTIDIHCGGSDLIFPHHENEIAQSEAANGKPFANYWMHKGFINVDHVKMSKSKGNFFTVRELAKQFPYPVLRFFMLLGHYRSPINFSAELLESAGRGLERIETCRKNLRFRIEGAGENGGAAAAPGEALTRALGETETRFVAALADDLNTPDALAAIFDLVSAANAEMALEYAEIRALADALELLNRLMDVLGFAVPAADIVPEEIQKKADARLEAKRSRDYARADQLRQEIQAAGYRLEDTPQGSKITKV